MVISRRHNPKQTVKTDNRSLERSADAGPPTTMDGLMLALKIAPEKINAATGELRRFVKEEQRLPTGYLLDDVKTFRRVGSLSNRLAKALRKLDDRSRYFLAVGFYDDEIMLNFILALENIAKEANKFKVDKRVANRPSGSIDHPLVQDLVSILYRTTETYGGKLTLSRQGNTARPAGSLPDAIAFVSAALPHQEIKIPSFQTLDRMRKAAMEEYRSEATRGGRQTKK